jgi:hypothetical protein
MASGRDPDLPVAVLRVDSTVRSGGVHGRRGRLSMGTALLDIADSSRSGVAVLYVCNTTQGRRIFK